MNDSLRRYLVLAFPVLMMVTASVAIIAAMASFGAADVGRSATVRGCNMSLVPGLVACGVVGGLAGGAVTTVRAALSQYPSHIVFVPERAALLVPLPLVLLVISAPGLFGCSLATSLERLPVLRDAALGAPGIALATCAALLVGVSLAAAWDVVPHVANGSLEPNPDFVSAVLADAEHRADVESSRYGDR